MAQVDDAQRIDLRLTIEGDGLQVSVLRGLLGLAEFRKTLTDALRWTLAGELELILEPAEGQLQVSLEPIEAHPPLSTTHEG